MLSSAGVGCCLGRCGKECTSWRRVDATKSRTGEHHLWDGMTVTRMRRGGRKESGQTSNQQGQCNATEGVCQLRWTEDVVRRRIEGEAATATDATKSWSGTGERGKFRQCRARGRRHSTRTLLYLQSSKHIMSSRIIAQRLTRARPRPRALQLSGPARSFASTSQHRAASGSLLSDDKAAEHDNRWKGTATNGGPTKLLIDGEWVNSTTNDWIDLHDPVRRSLPRLGTAPPYPADSHRAGREGGRQHSHHSTQEADFLSRCSKLI